MSGPQRRGEIGVRLALGAEPGSVAGMIVRQGALLACWLPARRAARVSPIKALRAD